MHARIHTAFISQTDDVGLDDDNQDDDDNDDGGTKNDDNDDSRGGGDDDDENDADDDDGDNRNAGEQADSQRGKQASTTHNCNDAPEWAEGSTAALPPDEDEGEDKDEDDEEKAKVAAALRLQSWAARSIACFWAANRPSRTLSPKSPQLLRLWGGRGR